jgi:ribosomal protein S18 acetylase RimI-like enzyme
LSDKQTINLILRFGTEKDHDFLKSMLAEGVCWRKVVDNPPIEGIMSHPDIVKILDGWGREGDTAIIAETPEGQPIGAAWYRFWTTDNHSFGYVCPAIPEIGMGVLTQFRQKGVGQALLQELFNIAFQNGVCKICLSVESDNPAIRLYQKFGFKKKKKIEDSWTMVAHTDPFK